LPGGITAAAAMPLFVKMTNISAPTAGKTSSFALLIRTVSAVAKKSAFLGDCPTVVRTAGRKILILIR
jgi:hypothetical protein